MSLSGIRVKCIDRHQNQDVPSVRSLTSKRASMAAPFATQNSRLCGGSGHPAQHVSTQANDRNVLEVALEFLLSLTKTRDKSKGGHPLYRYLVSCVQFLLAVVALPSWAADISLLDDPGRHQIVITGDITPGDYELFLNRVLEGGIKHSTVYLASRGGDALEAMKIGKAIRSLRFEVEVPKYFESSGGYCKFKPVADANCVCASACVLTYLGGIHRYGNYLGIHRTFLNHSTLKELDMEDAARVSRKISANLDLYLRDMGAPASFLEKMESTPSDEIEFLDDEYIQSNLGGYAKEFQEWVIAKCGSYSKIYNASLNASTDMEREKIGKEFSAVLDCERNLMRDEQKRDFYPAMLEAIDSANPDLIQTRSLLNAVKDKYPFEFSQLIGKPNHEAWELLSMAGFGNVSTPQALSKYVNVGRRFYNSVGITFDVDGTVASVDISFFESGNSKEYKGKFLEGLSQSSTPQDFTGKFGEPNRSGCYDATGVCTGYFTTKQADIDVVFNADKTLRAIGFHRPDYWKDLRED